MCDSGARSSVKILLSTSHRIGYSWPRIPLLPQMELLTSGKILLRIPPMPPPPQKSSSYGGLNAEDWCTKTNRCIPHECRLVKLVIRIYFQNMKLWEYCPNSAPCIKYSLNYDVHFSLTRILGIRKRWPGDLSEKK